MATVTHQGTASDIGEQPVPARKSKAAKVDRYNADGRLCARLLMWAIRHSTQH